MQLHCMVLHMLELIGNLSRSLGLNRIQLVGLSEGNIIFVKENWYMLYNGNNRIMLRTDLSEVITLLHTVACRLFIVTYKLSEEALLA